MPFTSSCVLEHYAGREWTVRSKLVFKTKDNTVIEVPKGFKTDSASVPRLFWVIWPPNGEYTKAAVLHDYMFYRKDLYSRKYTNKIFKQALRSENVGMFTSFIFHLAVKWKSRIS